LSFEIDIGSQECAGVTGGVQYYLIISVAPSWLAAGSNGESNVGFKIPPNPPLSKGGSLKGSLTWSFAKVIFGLMASFIT
jgi:hypothetical protein